jgi:hypothetical protein
VANHDERSVARIDLASGKVVADISVPSEPHRVAYGAGAVWVGNWHDDSVSRIDPATNRVVPTSRSASQPPGHERPRPPHARPCRPADRPQPWLARSTPPAGGSPASLGPGPYAASRLTTAPQALAPYEHHRGGHRSAGRAPALRGGRAGWPAHRSPHSRSPWPWSGRPVPLATHQLSRDDLQAVQVQQPRPRRTTVVTHLRPPLAGRQTSARYARPQMPFGALRRRQRHPTTLHGRRA